jgi:serine/threonine protein kinase
LIGKGAFGKVLLGVHKLTGKYVAIKTIDKAYMKNEFSRNKVLQEVYILKKVRHANIIRLFEVFEDALHILIVMEFAAGGDLLRYLKQRGRLPEAEARDMFRQIVYGLGHIHSRCVLHRDIKLDNILLDTEGGVKICDFGVSKIYPRGVVIKEQCGTPAYIAPEVITNEGYEGYYIDHWSLGIVLYAMLFAAVPFKGDNMSEMLSTIRSTPLTFPESISLEAKDLLAGLLQIDPYERLSVPEILAHPWMLCDSTADPNEPYMEFQHCLHPQATSTAANINITNLANLFFTDSAEEKLSYSDFCYISNDLYTQHIGTRLVYHVRRGGPTDLRKLWLPSTITAQRTAKRQPQPRHRHL